MIAEACRPWACQIELLQTIQGVGEKVAQVTLAETAGTCPAFGWMKAANYLATQHARLTARRGMGRAAVAVANSMLVSAYYILLRDEPCSDLGAGWLARRDDAAHARRLIVRIQRLGHTVVLNPVA